MDAKKDRTMEMRHLVTFVCVADLLNFTRAAEQLHLAQSSVSAQIRQLEEDLDVRLFDRIGRSVLLTEAGEKLYAYARRMNEMTKEIRADIKDDTHARGTLTIRAPETVASIYMPEVTRQFHNLHPKVKLKFINCDDRQLKEELNTGRIDLAFLLTDTVAFRDVNVRLLKEEKLIMAAGPGHPLTQKTSVTLADFHRKPFLFASTD
jgi:DNA-binding transcriptional LysR family regulator